MGIHKTATMKLKVEECSHIHVVICDTGYYFSKNRRDIGLRCKDCGTEWDVHLQGYSDEATIRPRVKRDA